MLTDALIVSLSRNFWDDVWRSRHQVMSRLARTNTVLFASRPLQTDEVMPWSRSKSRLRRPGTHRVTDNLYAYVPPGYLPTVHSLAGVERALEQQRRAKLRRVADRWRGRPSVLYLWHPSFEPYIDLFPESVVCYHLFDDLAMYGSERDGGVEAALQRIFARADLVFVASQELVERYAAFGNVHWVPNGVDYAAFARFADAPPPVPPDLAAIQGPRLGYVGTLRAQIDLDALIAIAGARPDWALVLIGDVSRGTSETEAFLRFRNLKNVHLLGPKKTDDVAAYLQHLDVGLLPYRLDGAARYCYPLKMHEYLAAGLPVVSSPLPAVQPFGSVIQTADTPADWVEGIRRSLEAVDPLQVQERRTVASRNSWDERVKVISTLIADTLSRPRGTSGAADRQRQRKDAKAS
jgi:glycosyltransferase involved in cell wall biosynthesis